MKAMIPKQTLLVLLALILFATDGPKSALALENFRIIEARYGAGETWQDVTQIVRSFVANEAISLKVSNENLQADPAPGREKALIVIFERHGKAKESRIQEGGWFIIPRPESGCQPPHHGTGKLEIIRALYGSGGKYRIVTGIIQSHVHHNNINMQVNNHNLGGDPTPNREKELLVIYRKQNREYGSHLREGSWFIVID